MIPMMLLSVMMAADPGAPAAMVLEIDGDVTAIRDGKELLLDDGDLLRVGDRVTVPAGGSLKAYFRPSGPVAALTGPAEATVSPGKLDSATQVAVRDTNVPARAAEGLVTSNTGSTLVGGLTLRSAERPQVHPVTGMVVTSDRPTFEWLASEGKPRYRLELVTGPEGKELPVWRDETTETKLAYPMARKPLTRGTGYRWRIVALQADGTSKVVVQDLPFQVLSEELAIEIPTIEKLAQSKEPADWRLAAEIYRSWGVYDEAVKLYEKLAEKRPDSAGVWELLASYYSQAGATDKAKAAKQKYEKLSKSQ